MSKMFLFMLMLFLGLAIQAQTLEDYLKIAEDSNPGLKARYAEFEAAMQKIPQVKSLPDPIFSVSAFGQMLETRVGPQRAIFILNQMFPWFGTLKAQGDAVTLMAEARFQGWLDARNELLYQVKSAYYPLYEQEQIIRFQRENKAIFETFKSLAVTRFKNGTGTMVDVIRVDIMIEDINTELKLLEEKRTPLLARFNKLLNRELQQEVAVSDTLVPEAAVVFEKDSILQNNPRLAELDKKIKSAQAQAVAAKKQGFPKLGVGLNYTVIGERTDTDMEVPGNGKDAIMPMISVSLPVNSKKYSAAVKEAEWMQTSFQEMKQEVSNGLLASYEMAAYDLMKAEEEYELFAVQKDKTRQAAKLLLSAYSNTGKDFEEVLRMQQMLLMYQTATATALKDYFTAMAKLHYLTAKK